MSMLQFPRQGAVQNLTTGAAAVNTSAWANRARVLIVATVAAWVKIGNGVTATATTSTYAPANWPMEFSLAAGDRISALEVSATGTLNITELS